MPLERRNDEQILARAGAPKTGFNFHPLRGKPTRYSLHVNGPWCITFEWDDGDALTAWRKISRGSTLVRTSGS